MITGLQYASHPKVHGFVHFTTAICASVQLYCMCRLAKLNIINLILALNASCIYILFFLQVQRESRILLGLSQYVLPKVGGQVQTLGLGHSRTLSNGLVG